MNYHLYSIHLPDYDGEGDYIEVYPFLNEQEAYDRSKMILSTYKQSNYPISLISIVKLEFKDFHIEITDKKQYERNRKIDDVLD